MEQKNAQQMIGRFHNVIELYARFLQHWIIKTSFQLTFIANLKAYNN
jgi:hypothetical protein